MNTGDHITNNVTTPPEAVKTKEQEDAAGVVLVPEKLVRPHYLIQQTRRLYKTANLDDYKRFRPTKNCLAIFVTPRCRCRAFLIMDTILKECKRRGWPVTIPEGDRGGTVVTVNGGKVPIELIESLGREPREKNTYEKNREASRGRPMRYPTYSYFPSGLFTLKMTYPDAKGRHSWREWKRFRMEDLLTKFMASLAEAGDWTRMADEYAARQKARKDEEDLKRWERARLRHEEQERVDDLIAKAEAWHKSRKLRTYIDAYMEFVREATAKVGVKVHKESEIGRWETWARQQADRIDPLAANPPSILDENPDTFHWPG
jgi:hypothetical protein